MALLTLASFAVPSRAAVDEIAVAQGHWLYNVRQSLFVVRGGRRIPANHTPVTGRCISAPTGGQTSSIAVSDVIQNSPSSAGSYRFNVFANSNAVEGTYVLQFTDGRIKSSTRNGKILTPTLAVKVRKIAVTGISFVEGEGGLAIRLPGNSNTQSSDQVIEAYEWASGGRDYPGAFVRLKVPATEKKIKVRLAGPPNSTYRISASGDFSGIREESVRFNAQGIAVSGTDGVPKFKIQVFPSIVTKKDVAWQWRATQGTTTTNLNSTSHRIYSVWDTPETNAKYETLYEFGCGWADGEFEEDEVIRKIWLGLSSGMIRLERDQQIAQREGRNAPYWRYWGSQANGVAALNYWGLFIRKDGQCGAWGKFGAELLKLQGIPAYEYPIEPIRAPVTGRNGVVGYRYGLLVKDTADHQGQPEAGWTSPRFFADHALTRKNFSLYDPSFHNGPWTDSTVLNSLNRFENDSIKEFGVARADSSGQLITNAQGAVLSFDSVSNTTVREMREIP